LECLPPKRCKTLLEDLVIHQDKCGCITILAKKQFIARKRANSRQDRLF